MIRPAMETPVSPIERLRRCADLWLRAHSATVVGRPPTLARLGRAVVNDGGFFARLADTESTTTATLDKFAHYLLDPVNWPEGEVPDEARIFAHVMGVTRPADPASPDNESAGIGGGSLPGEGFPPCCPEPGNSSAAGVTDHCPRPRPVAEVPLATTGAAA